MPVPAEPRPPAPTGSWKPSPPTETPIPAAAAAQIELATDLAAPADQIAIVSAERVEWPDACQGAAAYGEVCAQVITPDCRIVMETNGMQCVAHTDENGRAVLLTTP